ncbi:MAG: bifunctional riboflavin kinase/FAD synthetase [Deltaproteobacteria bacterium]|nr:bifunctional riboflavin kinase/FAD synthetase [Deltaproteobacteria bacterium]
MRYFKSDSKNPLFQEETAVSIGNFDGVHIAHQRLINESVNFAKKSGLVSAVLTFRPHTAHLFDRFGSPHLIMDYDEKIEEIAKLGPDIIIEQKFDEEFASMSTDEFLYGYLGGIKARAIFTGYDFSFSRSKQANHNDLREFGRKSGAFIWIMEPQMYCGTKISSTKIRNLLQEGNIVTANQLLGRRYYISGVVVRGKMLGRRIGAGTANICITNRLVPREGVYMTIAEIDGRRFRAVSNIGKTSKERDIPVLETHILDFDEELYDKRIKVEFLRFIRPEIRFDSLERLTETIKNDIATVRNLFGEMNEDI